MIGDRLMWIYSHVESIAGRGKSKCKLGREGMFEEHCENKWEESGGPYPS